MNTSGKPLVWGLRFAALATLLAGVANAEDVYRYGPHWGLEKVDEKVLAPVDLDHPEKQLVANGITFNITYEDPANVGFNDPAQGANRKARLEDAFSYVASVLNETGELDVLVKPSQFDGSGFLAAAVTLLSGTAGYQNGAAFFRLKDPEGDKQFPGQPDIQVIVDFGFNFFAGTGNPTGAQVDLLSVLTHEATHGMGFVSGIKENGESRFAPGVYTVFDQFVRRVTSGVDLVAGSPPAYSGAAPVALPPPNLPTSPDLISNDLGFNGDNAVAAFGGMPPLESHQFTPAPAFRLGSSIQHWDPNVPGDGVMVTSFTPGQVVRTFRCFEIGVLNDLGYENAAAPGTECTEGEGEGETPCDLQSVVATTPATDVTLGAGQTAANVGFTASVAYKNTPSGCTQTEVRVSYRLNGVEVAGSTDAGSNFTALATNVAPGNYTLTARATVTASSNSVTSSSRTFRVLVPPPAATVTSGGSAISTVAFGEVATGSSAVSDLTVSNTGGGTLTGTATASGTGFSVISGGSYSLAANASQQVRVRFAPAAAGAASGSLTFTGGASNVVIALTGTSGSGKGGGCSCGPTPPAGALRGDALVMLAAAAFLGMAARRARAGSRA